jgi:hypothetical protein
MAPTMDPGDGFVAVPPPHSPARSSRVTSSRSRPRRYRAAG